MDVVEPQPVGDVSGAGWIAPRLGPFGSGRVDSVVPAGFAGYARVLHPLRDADGRPATWAAVCARLGATAHPLMQWNAIAGVVHGTAGGVTTSTARWPGEPPWLGSLDPAALGALLAVLAAHTRRADLCYLALWEGYGQVWTHAPRHAGPARGSDPTANDPISNGAILDGPRLRLPSRDYVLFRGPLAAAAAVGRRWDPHWAQSPNLFWPADRSWCVASEIDFDSTLVAGPAALIDGVLADPALEAWRVGPGDSLAYDADTINT
jgi:hypothetical protein